MCAELAMSSKSKKEEAIKLIASGIKGDEAARIVGCDPSTISKWSKNDPEFIAEIEKRRSNQVTEIREKLLDIFKKALPNLESVAMGSPECKGYGKTIEIIARSIGLLDKQLDVTNCYRYRSHLDRDRFLELRDEQARIFDRLCPEDRQWCVDTVRAKQQ